MTRQCLHFPKTAERPVRWLEMKENRPKLLVELIALKTTSHSKMVANLTNLIIVLLLFSQQQPGKKSHIIMIIYNLRI